MFHHLSLLTPSLPHYPLVSIIIPARNEEKNIDPLLQSLLQLQYPHYEIIVVDDHSQDQTKVRAEKYPVTVISSPPLPSGWSGKNWSCYQGFKASKGDYLLFTDADTLHHPDSLNKSMFVMIPASKKSKLDLLSAPPYHLSPSFWEKFLAPFHLLIFFATNIYGTPALNRLFSIGQYLLFRRHYYEHFLNHEHVKNDLAEDLSFARMILQQKGQFAVYPYHDLYQVRMYESFSHFIQGWRRIFRWGLKRNDMYSIMEVFILVYALLGAGTYLFSYLFIPFYLCFAFVMAVKGREIGQFYLLSPLLYPISLILFIVITLLSLWDQIFQRNNNWKDRKYHSQQF